MVCGVYCGSGVFPGRLVQHVKAFYKNNIVFGFFFCRATCQKMSITLTRDSDQSHTP